MELITSSSPPPKFKLNPSPILHKRTHKPSKSTLCLNSTKLSRCQRPQFGIGSCRQSYHARKPISGYTFSRIIGSRCEALNSRVLGGTQEGDLRETNSCDRILLSDVIVERPRNVFVGRSWSVLDVATLGVVVAMHVLALFGPFVFNWGAFWVAVGLYVATGMLGICLSFHRNLSHRSFKLPKFLEYFCAYCGVQALQGNPIDWVSTHRFHHQYCDSDKDPHSPLEGFWFSHMNWLFDHNEIFQKCGKASNVADLEKQQFYRFMRRTYILHPLALGVLLYVVGGLPFLVWGMGVRTVWVYHITWFVNSACHVWGSQAWNTGDLSRNNWWVAMLSFGEGWHNNHHAFEYSARHGLEWWQVDLTWYTIRLLQAIGLATDVKLPTQAHKQRMAPKGVTSS